MRASTERVLKQGKLLVQRFIIYGLTVQRFVSTRSRRIALVISFVLTGLATFVVYSGWNTAVNSSPACGYGLSTERFVNNYLEVDIKGEDLSEPVFNGSFRLNASETYRKGEAKVLDVEVVSGGGRNMPPGLTSAKLSWDPRLHVLAGRSEDTYFNPLSRSHHYFPFDSADFDFTFTTEPAIAIPQFQIINRVPGFYMPCDTVRVQDLGHGALRFAFSLRRDLLTRLTAVMLGISAIIFAFAITRYVEAKALPTAVASYFFTLWSARGIFALPPEAFPTLIDVAVLTLCLLLLLLLALRLLWRTYERI